MRLVHWSSDIVTEVHGHRQVDPFDPDLNKKARLLPGKPHAFWLSDESRGAYGWKAWCKSERFRTYGLRYEHEVKLSPKAKILYLRTPEEIDDFTRKYGFSLLDELAKKEGRETFTDEMTRKYGMKRETHYDGIYWREVAKKYHGVIITPYQWSRRLDGISQWYYGWDCASGAIWNARAIESITMVKEHKAPKKPTYWQQRRAHKRQMMRMAIAGREMAEALKGTDKATGVEDALIQSSDNLMKSLEKEV